MLAMLIFVLILFPSNRQVQMIVVVLTAFIYIIWGLIHHYLNHDLKTRIVIEYIVVGGLGISVIFFLLKGAGL